MKATKSCRLDGLTKTKNEYKRREKGSEHILYDMKSRMVGRGDLSDIDGIRTDSPTADVEARSFEEVEAQIRRYIQRVFSGKRTGPNSFTTTSKRRTSRS